MDVIELLIFFGAIANDKNKMANTSTVRPPFPASVLSKPYHGVVFTHICPLLHLLHPFCDDLDKDFFGLLSFFSTEVQLAAAISF